MTRKFLRRTAVAAALALSGCLSISDPPEGLTVFSIIGGNNQTVTVNTFALSPLVVQTLDQAAAPMSGVTVTWEILSGTGTLSASSTPSTENGTATITFKAGGTPGPVQIRAQAEDLRVTFQVDVVSG